MSDVEAEIEATIQAGMRSLNMHHRHPGFFDGMSDDFARQVQRNAALQALEVGQQRIRHLIRRRQITGN